MKKKKAKRTKKRGKVGRPRKTIARRVALLEMRLEPIAMAANECVKIASKRMDAVDTCIHLLTARVDRIEPPAAAGTVVLMGELEREQKHREILEKEHSAVCQVVQRFAEARGHARCHWNPEMLEELCVLLGIDYDVKADMSREEFEAGCKKFQDEIYGEQK